MDRRQFLQAAGASAALATIPGLSNIFKGEKSRFQPADTSVTGHITIAFYGAADIIKAWDVVFADFRKVYPNITVEAVAIPAATWTAFADSAILQMAGGREFDVLQGAVNVQRLLVTKDVVAPLDAFIQRDHAELAYYLENEAPQFLKWEKSLVSQGGPTYFLPADYNVLCCWVNTEMFEKAGVPVPSDGWTWDDLLAAGEKICTSPGTYLIDVPADDWDLMPWALTNGGTLLSADWTKSTCASPQTIEAAAFVQSLHQKGYAPKPGGSFSDPVEFADNKLAIFQAGMWLNPALLSAKAAGKAKVVACPQKVQKGTVVGWNAYPITKSSKNKEAAWAFVKYVSSERASVNLTATGQATPGLKSVFYSDLHKAAPEKGINEFWTELEYATPLPCPAAADAIDTAFANTLTQLYSSNADAATLMKALDKEVNGLLNNTGPGSV
jgi:multiple sugar transport system substrate-binding protein